MDSPVKSARASSLPATPAEAAPRRSCFVISPIGPTDSAIRKKSDQVLEHVIKRALDPPFDVKRADDESRPGLITVQILQRIFDADLVVADLTDRNPNVYYELAIRHAYRKPAIHIITKDENIPFDVQDMRVVPYDLTNPDSLDEARRKLGEYVKAIDQGEPVITPVQFAEILQSFGAGESRDEQLRALFASLSAGISNLQEGMAVLVQEQRNRKQREALQSFLNPSSGTLADLLAPPASGFNFPTGQPSIYQPSVYRSSASEAPSKHGRAKHETTGDAKESEEGEREDK